MMAKPRASSPGQADLVIAWLGTVAMLMEGEPLLPLEVAGQAATMVVSRMSWDEPWSGLTRPRATLPIRCPECGMSTPMGAIHVCAGRG